MRPTGSIGVADAYASGLHAEPAPTRWRNLAPLVRAVRIAEVGAPSGYRACAGAFRRFSVLVLLLAVSMGVPATTAGAAGDAPILQSVSRLSGQTSGSSGQSYGDQLWEAVKGPLATVLKWLVYAILIIGAVWVLLLLRRLWRLLPPRRGTIVVVEDLVADLKDRQTASHVLSRRLLTEITSLGSTEGGEIAEIDETGDLDGTFVANLRIAGEGVEKLDSLAEGETAVSVGPLSFSLKQLGYYLGSLFRRRSEYELVGSLTEGRDRVMFTVENQGPAGQVLNRWHSTRNGDHAADEAVRDVAMQIVVGLGRSTATADWRSFRDYRDALDVLGTSSDAPDPRARLESARALLARSLDRDPLNPLARFYLATVNRKLGDNDEAVEQFRLLESFATRQDSGWLEHFKVVHPEFRRVVRYNLATSLLKLEARKAQREALRIVNGLVEQFAKPGPVPLADSPEYRFGVLVRSAQAWALTFRLERELNRQEPDTKSPDARQAYRAQLLSEIESVRNSIQGAVPASTTASAVYAGALATAETAFGRASELLGRQKDAFEAYRRATTLLPDLVDPQLNLVELLFDLKEFGWQEQAEAAIRQTLAVDPSNLRAEYLYGRLCADPSVARYEEAKEHLTRAGSYPEALFLHAQIVAEQEGDLPGALKLLDRAIALAPAPGHRLLSYVNFVLQLAREGRADRDLLLRARERANRLATDGITGRFRRRGAELREELDAALAKDEHLTAERGRRGQEAPRT
jgi:tetratricopeptide (TPR) repeat protein